MDVGRAFTFISEDENWTRKLGIGAIVGLVPFLNFAVFGYQVQISRNVARDEERPLPEWNNLGDLFMDGLRIIGAMFVYMLPIILLYGLMIILFFVSNGFPTANEFGGSPPDFSPGFLAVVGLFLLCGLPYTMLVWLLWPMLFIQVARRNSIAACFNLREMWQLIRQDWVNYLLVVGLYLGLSMGASFVIMPVAFVLMLIPCLGFIVVMLLQAAVMILIQAVSGHVQGQFIRLNDKSKPDPAWEVAQ